MRLPLPVATLLVLPLFTSAYKVPEPLADFYDLVKNGGCTSFYRGRSDLSDGQGNWGYGFCDDTPGAIYVSGEKHLADMDIDCDGAANCGSLKKNSDFQPETAFDDTLAELGYAIPGKSLNASVIPYAVLGTCDVPVAKNKKEKGPVPELGVVAVVCGDKLRYAVFGDTNGCDDDNFTGEASIALARMCFPDEGLDGDNGHTDHDVLYLAFTSEKAVPGPSGAKWDAKTPEEFEASIKDLGDELLEELFKDTEGRTKVGEVGDYGADKKKKGAAQRIWPEKQTVLGGAAAVVALAGLLV
ncbi:fungal chitosanase [Ascodesmis nigricans]|uniref:Endo-chitosanase n=1 Tax=Ascodesmis nigricans TaxID=341454 RepID=A0A4S2N1Y0_9PEZI|nr:fungal chitosanase [Ascodesmis nigricans]